jgi:hypothetical protein
MRQVTERLWEAVAEVVKLRHPSIAEILRKRGFGHEGAQMDELVAAFDEMVKLGSKGNGQHEVDDPD